MAKRRNLKAPPTPLAELAHVVLNSSVTGHIEPHAGPASDEFGWKAEQQVVSHDLHAPILYLLGMDHKRLTYFYNGRNMRLTDVAGKLIPQIVD